MNDDVDPEFRSHDADPDELRIRDLLALGGMLVGCIVAGLVAGLLLDVWLGTSPALALAGTAFGIALAGVGFWLRVRAYLRG